MNLSDFLPEIYLEAPSCPEAVALDALRKALREFCERSHAWQADLDSISLLASQPSYDIDTPVDSELVAILRARYDTLIIPIYTPVEMDELFIDWRTSTGSGLIAVAAERTSLWAYPVPSADDSTALEIRAAIKPTLLATTCGDDLDQWREGISAGALARLKKMAGKAWTDREGVATYRAEFNSAVFDARWFVLKGHSAFGDQIATTEFV